MVGFLITSRSIEDARATLYKATQEVIACGPIDNFHGSLGYCLTIRPIRFAKDG